MRQCCVEKGKAGLDSLTLRHLECLCFSPLFCFMASSRPKVLFVIINNTLISMKGFLPIESKLSYLEVNFLRT